METCRVFGTSSWWVGATLAIGLSVVFGSCGKGQVPETKTQPQSEKPDLHAQGPKPGESQGKAEALKSASQVPKAKAPAKGVADAQNAKPSKAPSAKEERPLYYERELRPEDLKGRTLREFSLMRNTIFARVGNRFRKTWLDEHFRAQPWYKPQEKTQLDRLTSIDKKNVELIVQAQESLTKADLERARDALLAMDPRTKLQEQELRLLSVRLGKWSGDEQNKDPDRTPLEDPKLLDKVLRLSSLREMSRRDLRILRNMIYARRGRAFKSPLVDAYFGRMDWFDPVENFKPSMLTATDRKNIRIVKSLEHSLGGPIRDAAHPEDDWMYVA